MHRWKGSQLTIDYIHSVRVFWFMAVNTDLCISAQAFTGAAVTINKSEHYNRIASHTSNKAILPFWNCSESCFTAQT